MSDSPRGVMAASNRFEIKAEIVEATASSRYPGKWELSLRLIQVKHISGPDMVSRQAGSAVPGFTFDPPFALTPGKTIEAKAEYQGGARHGFLQIFEIVPCAAP